jgi:hypothetical protein
MLRSAKHPESLLPVVVGGIGQTEAHRQWAARGPSLERSFNEGGLGKPAQDDIEGRLGVREAIYGGGKVARGHDSAGGCPNALMCGPAHRRC